MNQNNFHFLNKLNAIDRAFFVCLFHNPQGRNFFEGLIKIFTSPENPLIQSITEMGGSMLTVAYTIELVPLARPFQWGADYFCCDILGAWWSYYIKLSIKLY